MLGNGEGKLKQREIEYLSNLIEEKSRVKLSISTLKRLWRTDLQQLPHPATFDASVSVLDFKDWQEFKKQNTPQPATGDLQKGSGTKFPFARCLYIFPWEQLFCWLAFS